MSTPSIAPRATDHTLDAQARAAESSCCSILIKTALTVAIVAAAVIAFTVTLACASPPIGLVVLCVALPITAIFLSATWAGHTTHMPYSPTREYVHVPVRTPSPAFFEAPPRHFFSEPASASRFGAPAAAAFADRPFESVWGLPRRGLEFGHGGAIRRTDLGMAAAAPRAAVGGVDFSMPAVRAAAPGGNVAVSSRH